MPELRIKLNSVTSLFFGFQLFLLLFIPPEARAWQPPVDPDNKEKGYWNSRFQWHQDDTGVHLVLTRGSTQSGEGSHSQVLYYYGGGTVPFTETLGTNQPRVWKLNPYDAFACSGPGACDDTISVLTYPWNQNPNIPFVNSDVGLFCSGHAGLSDGRILITGGTEIGEGTGIDGCRIFDPATRAFSAGPTMLGPRWYPTATTLGDGAILTTGGSKSWCRLHEEAFRSFGGEVCGVRGRKTTDWKPIRRCIVDGTAP